MDSIGSLIKVVDEKLLAVLCSLCTPCAHSVIISTVTQAREGTRDRSAQREHRAKSTEEELINFDEFPPKNSNFKFDTAKQ